MRRAVEMPPCDRPVHGLASLGCSMHRPLTGLGKLAGEVTRANRGASGGEFSTFPQPRLRVKNNKKEFDRNETNDIT